MKFKLTLFGLAFMLIVSGLAISLPEQGSAPQKASIALEPVSENDELFNTTFTSDPGWTETGGGWTVDSGVYNNSANGTSVKADEYTDGFVYCDVTINSGRFAGILFRYQDDTNYYWAHIDDTANTLRITQVLAGSICVVWTLSYTIATETQYTVGISFVQGQLMFYLDGVRMGGVYIAGGAFTSGKVGLMSGYPTGGFDTAADFDNFYIYEVPRVNEISANGQTIVNMDNGSAWGASFYGYVADGYPCRSFFPLTEQASFNYTLHISEEAYYQVSLRVGDLGGDDGVNRLLVMIGDCVVGMKAMDSVASGVTTSFNGLEQTVIFGAVRLPVGYHNLRIINPMNASVVTEDAHQIMVDRLTEDVETPLFSFVQVTDTHFDPDAVTTYGGAGGHILLTNNSLEILKQFVNQTNALVPQPDFVVVTGDLAAYAGADYIPYRAELELLDMPYYLISGNHDHYYKEYLASTFDDLFPEFADNQFYYYRDVNGSRLIFLDGDSGGGVDTISTEQYAWLNETLDTEQSVFVFIHYPLIGITFGLTEREAIKDILETNDNVVSVYSGHCHRNTMMEENGILYITTGSLIEWPMTVTQTIVYGTTIDVFRLQIDNYNRLTDSTTGANLYLSFGYESYTNYTPFLDNYGYGDWTDGWYYEVGRVFDSSGVQYLYDRPVYGHEYVSASDILSARTSSGTVNAYLTQWDSAAKLWTANASSASISITFTVYGLDSTLGYKAYQDGDVVATGYGPSFSFTVTGASEFELVEWYGKQVSTLIVMTVNMVGLGIFVAVVAGWVIPFSRAIKAGTMKTNEQMMKNLMKGVVFIIIALIMWGMLQRIAIG